MNRPTSTPEDASRERIEHEHREGAASTHEERLNDAANQAAESGRNSGRASDDTRQSTV